jgi:hypothetical protein
MSERDLVLLVVLGLPTLGLFLTLLGFFDDDKINL